MDAVTDNVRGMIVPIILIFLVVAVLARGVRIIPQAQAGIVERLGKYHRTLNPGPHFLIPFVDRLLPLLNLREQIISFPPQSVITEDNLAVSIDTVVYFHITDARSATYEVTNYVQAIEQLMATTLRDVVGELNLEQALTNGHQINKQLRVVLEETAGRWGIQFSRVELKAIRPPLSIQNSLEKQIRSESDRRAAILAAEGERQSTILRAEGEAQAIEKVFEAIHRGGLNQKLLTYQYLQILPKLAEGASNKLWIIPSEISETLKDIDDTLCKTSPGTSEHPMTTTGTSRLP